jgi:hypothetical protein
MRRNSLFVVLALFIAPMLAFEILEFLAVVARCILSINAIWVFVKKNYIDAAKPSAQSARSISYQKAGAKNNFLTKDDLMLLNDLASQ